MASAVETGIAASTITELVASLQNSDFETAVSILSKREASLKSAIEREFSNELNLKEVEKVKLSLRCNALDREIEKYKAISSAFDQQIDRIRSIDEERKVKYRKLESRLAALEKENLRLRVKLQQINSDRLGGNVIMITDSDDEADAEKLQGNIQIKTDDLEDFDSGDEIHDLMGSRNPKRKCTSRVITSDDETEAEDDNVTLPMRRSNLRRQSDGLTEDFLSNITRSSRRRLSRLGEQNTEVGGDVPTSARVSVISNQTPKIVDRVSRRRSCVKRKLRYSDDEDSKDECNDETSETSDESLSRFIVNDSEVDSEPCSNARPHTSSTDASDDDIDLHTVIAKIRREKDSKVWEYEADMLSSFSKDPEVCLKAVCALYQQQTSEEQSAKGALFINGRGFNKFDAERGSLIAEFLLNGDSHGSLKKSVEDLQRFDQNALEYCQQLARRYSNHLFKIYKGKEDPFLCP